MVQCVSDCYFSEIYEKDDSKVATVFNPIYLCGIIFLPWLVIPNHGIHNNNQFSHASG
jgi:hypothetical protein